MAWQGLHLTQKARLSYADRQIVIELNDSEIRRPVEDLAWVIVDSPQVTMTSPLLSALCSAGVALLITDQRHLPNGMLIPFHTHFRQAGVAQIQIGVSRPVQKRLWQNIVRQKIANQAAILSCVDPDGARALAQMARHVGSGDPDNVEARAARHYWPRLFSDFTREDEKDIRNAALNYGYAVLRGAVARAIVAVGAIPSIGIQHASITNGYNLADDMMEPFRPAVDYLVHKLAPEKSSESLRIEIRRELAGICTNDIAMGSETMSILTAAEKMAISFITAMESADPSLLSLPAPILGHKESS